MWQQYQATAKLYEDASAVYKQRIHFVQITRRLTKQKHVLNFQI